MAKTFFIAARSRPTANSITRGAAFCLFTALIAPSLTTLASEHDDIEEIVVTSQRLGISILRQDSNVERLGHDDILRVEHQHLHELLTRVPGVWLSRGSGQESLAAIRSPVLSGAGSCGAILTLEDGIPTRPAGFCNVNQLFELDTEQARSIEVIRGPGSVLYGSNALHGTINVLMPQPGDSVTGSLGIDFGANDFYRLRGELPLRAEQPWRASFILAKDGGFRADSGYRQGKAHAKYKSELFGGELTSAFTATDLYQDTAGFIIGKDAYKDPALNRSNANPEAFRDAASQRLYALWNRSMNGFELDVRPYFRHSSMQFLQHFLPGQPLEENGQSSLGAMVFASFDKTHYGIITGFDFDWSDSYLKETQDGPADGSAFLEATRPAGKHYDYTVDSLSLAAYIQARFDLSERLRLTAGLRLENTRYDYDNRMLVGNTKDDGSECGFGGCLYTRPADSSDDFTDLAPRLGLNYLVSQNFSVYASYGQGFRAPQMTELYRLQSGQRVADLESEQIGSVEVGLRAVQERWSIDTAVFYMRKRNSVLRDAEGFNVNGGRSRHRGVELALNATPFEQFRLSLNASYAHHTYDFNQVAERGETFVAGRDVDTAPRLLASAEFFYIPVAPLELSLQWTTIGKYYLDAENLFTYPGHDLWNFRAAVDIGRHYMATLRLNNVTDTDFADRADYAFGNYRYFPGRGRELFIELQYFGNPF
ncbi:MAG TPA: TonB-dependent receptor [Woeseiaceae bacterium]|nr:TonB-dependent receptor [Woeseiaceae bacterium]